MGDKLFPVTIFLALVLQGQIASAKRHFGKAAEINKLEVDTVPTTALPAAVPSAAAVENLPAEQETNDALRNTRQDLKSENGVQLVMRQAADATDRLQQAISDLLGNDKDLVEISHSQLNSNITSKPNVANRHHVDFPIVLSQTG
ncbi:unnamed protein product [Orchesella dallaii]|uniref:Uncharacterized protein n=1 Tax=Orchesella dallaii TaxID=48710 RepID=A0ABP1QCM6_9HEXA